jgi:hypothetical protein
VVLETLASGAVPVILDHGGPRISFTQMWGTRSPPMRPVVSQMEGFWRSRGQSGPCYLLDSKGCPTRGVLDLGCEGATTADHELGFAPGSKPDLPWSKMARVKVCDRC